MKKLVRLLLSTAFAGAAVGVSGAGTVVTPPLIGTVGPGFNISLTDSTGTPISHLDPGTYTIQVSDKSDLHNFHLRGPGVDQATDVETIGDATWTVTFGNGRYTYLCDAHPTQMHRTFTSGVVPATPKLTARVGPGRKISLRTASGAKVTSLAAGPYKIVVSDRSRVDNFHLTGPGVNKKTTIRGRGTQTWNLTIRAGRYRFRSDAHKRLAGSFRAT